MVVISHNLAANLYLGRLKIYCITISLIKVYLAKASCVINEKYSLF
jgi:hypothetical protein